VEDVRRISGGFVVDYKEDYPRVIRRIRGVDKEDFRVVVGWEQEISCMSFVCSIYSIFVMVGHTVFLRHEICTFRAPVREANCTWIN
jgi:hypothetical protein